jgi:hypothetical protein
MSSSLSFFSFISELISEANDGLHQAMEASQDQPVIFTIPQIDMQIKCIILNDGKLKIVPSNAEARNYYGAQGESELQLTFKLKP